VFFSKRKNKENKRPLQKGGLVHKENWAYLKIWTNAIFGLSKPGLRYDVYSRIWFGSKPVWWIRLLPNHFRFLYKL